MKELSVIIVSYNTKNLLNKCILSVMGGIKNIDFDIIVVDNGSSDGSIEMLKSDFPNVRCIKNDKNMGFAKANNEGVFTSECRYVLLLNSDTVFIEGDLGELLRVFERDKSIGAIGCKVLNGDRTIQHSCYRFPSLFYEYLRFTFWCIKFSYNPVYNQSRMVNWDHEQIRVVDCIAGCFIITKKSIIDKLGLFDEQFFMSYEDADFCLKLKRHGFKVIYFPYIKIIHHCGQSKAKDPIVSNKMSFLGMKYYFKKNRNVLVTFFLLSFIYMSWVIFIFIFTILILFFKNERFKKKKKLFKELLAT